MRAYKLVLILKSGQTEEKKQKLLSEIKKWIGEHKEKKVEEIGEKKLSYPIKKEMTGECIVLHFEAKSIAGDLDKKIHMRDDIIRHLLVHAK